ncbi:twin-arginine translocase subunit TatC [Candidatus Berkiella aquae]|uniref:Sec-independent protein translocase protein TatC n=1 Tax=Candidatus Berkiella aquae TaxID=295108 RepID=A0A0Q9YZF8_9GAMM|nr:twin-arginine translocase subunit TatC [Candidatus Berkiella aquae]MCS5712646.1 twin-arginine translocase subunit TatC [Candidatus Berkiella aquae]
MENLEKYLPHFIELRQRLIRCCLAYALVLTPLLIYCSNLYTLLAQPILKSLPSGGMLIATEVITPFTAPLKLAFFTALVLIIPFILYQIWRFVAPGLYPNEKRMVFPIVFMSAALFYIGMLFAHFLVLPMALGFFMQVAPEGVTVMTDMTHYMDFVLVLYFAFGASFQVPIVTFILIRTGITSVEGLKKHRPYIIVGAFVIGMLLTPPDVVSQILLAVPLLGLFEGGVLLAKCFPPKKTES